MILYKWKDEVHNMNENKRMLILLISIVLVIAVILLIAFWPEPDTTFVCGVKADKEYTKLGSINYSQYECLAKESDKYAIVVSDGLSDKEKASINKAAEKINTGIYYLSDEVSNSDLKKIKKELKTDLVSYDKTSLIVVEDGKVKYGMDKNLGNSAKVYDFLEESGLFVFACDTEPDEEYKNLAKLTPEQYDCLYNGKEPFIMVITSSTCHYCQEYLPLLNDYVGENHLPAYILEYDTMNQSDAQSIISTLMGDEMSGTPLTLAIKDKEIVAQYSGYTSNMSEIENLYKQIDLK